MHDTDCSSAASPYQPSAVYIRKAVCLKGVSASLFSCLCFCKYITQTGFASSLIPRCECLER